MSQLNLGPKAEDLKDPKNSIKSGFMWLGIAKIFSQIMDAVSLILVMFYISKEEMGLATLAVSFAACIESVSGLSLSAAIIQDNKLTENETHSLFWFTVFFAIGASLLILPFIWPVAFLCGNMALVPLFAAGIVKFVGSSIGKIPIGLVTRRLQYARNTLLNTVLSLLSSGIKIGLAIFGFGAWALVLANTFYGIGYFIGGMLIAEYLPVMHFRWSECKRNVSFGLKQCLSGFLETFNQNLHYFLVGKLFGEGILGVYRVGYELAMTPAIAFLNVVNSSSYPVFSKFKSDRGKLSELFAWNQGNIALFSAVPILFIFFCSDEIFMLIKDGAWMGAVKFIPLALCVAMIKTLMQTFPELYRACGRPDYSFKVAAVESILIAIFFVSSIMACRWIGFDDNISLNAMFCSWLLMFIPLFMIHRKIARQFIDVGFRSTLRSISKALVFMAICGGMSVIPWLYSEQLPWSPWLHMGIEAAIMAGCLGLYVKFFKKKAGSV